MKCSIFTISVMIVLILLCSPAWCGEQNSKAEPSVELDEIVVTSTRTEHQVMDTPSNISVITAKDIEAMDAKTIADVLDKLPGAYISNASGFVPHISLRGTRIGMSAGAMVLLNGIPMAIGKFGYVDWDTIPVESIERVEVVKGPLSSLYGGDAARGVISITTKTKAGETKGKIQTAFGEYGDRRASGLIYGGSDDLDYNLSVKKVEDDGYRRECGIDNVYATGDVGYWFSQEGRVGLTVSVSDVEKYLGKSLDKAQKEADRRQPDDLSFTDSTDVIAGLNVELSKDIFDLKVNAYHKNRDKSYKNYLKATSTPYKEEVDQKVSGIKTILTLKQPVSNVRNSLSFGFDYDHDDSDLDKIKGKKGDTDHPYDTPDPKGSGNFIRKSFGAFAQDELSFQKSLTLTLGLRYDNFSYDNDAGYDFTDGGTYNYDKTPSFDRWNPRVGMNYRVVDNFSLYCSYNTAYRAPTIYDYYGTGSYSAKGGYDLEPEKFIQYETGFRWQLAEWLNLDLCVYQIDIEEMLDSYYDEEGNYAGKRNMAQARMRGVETSFSGSFLENRVRYKLGHSYVDARYGENTFDRDPSKQRVSIDGNRMTKMPYNTLNADLNAALLTSEDYRLDWHIGMKAQGAYPMDTLNMKEYGGHTLVESRLTFDYKGFSIFVAADNLLDEEYDYFAYYTPTSDTENYYPAPGRTFSSGISYDF